MNMYEPQNFDHLAGLPGFSEPMLKNHFTLYQGYVTNVNKNVEILGELTKEGKTNSPMYAEVQRRLGWEWNGMRLHELYFSNMTKESRAAQKESGLGRDIARIYGSFENWEKDFRTVGAMRGIGWTILYYDQKSKELFNVWVNEHDVGHLAGCAPLLVLDVFEHAYMPDYGLKRADYIEAFMKATNWDIVEGRYLKNQI